MNQTLRDAFTRLQDDAGQVDVDVQALVDAGETRLRRRRLSAVLGGTAAVVVAITIGVSITLHGATTLDQEPSPLPPADGNKDGGMNEGPPTRQIVYGDTKAGAVSGGTVHFGGRVVQTGNGHVHLDVTDDGFLYTDRGRVWFSDGDTPEQVGSLMCPGEAVGDPGTHWTRGQFGNYDTDAVMTADSGSTAAWFDCWNDPAHRSLVVFDTSSREVAARRPVPFACCDVSDLTNNYVYFGDYRFDLTTHRVRPSTPQEHAEDLRSQPRGLVLGDDWQSGTPITGDRQLFTVAGSKLVPLIWVDTDHHQVTSAFDLATQRVLRLRLPTDYQADSGDAFAVFEWLDDDTIALVGGHADILTCQLSSGHCVLAVPGPDSHTWRIVPRLPLPG